MSIKITFDETHNEQITLYNCKKFQEIMKKYSVAVFRLLIGPITSDKLVDEDVLFIGAPKDSFTPDEILAIRNFVLNGGFIVIVCDSARIKSLNINALAKEFNVRVNFNHVKDEKNHWKNAIYFPYITNFNKSILTKNIKKLTYSGATLSLFTEDCIPIAFTSQTADPPNSPVIATSYYGRCIIIGGSTLFYDEDFGIFSAQNQNFVANLIKYLIYGKKYPLKIMEIHSKLTKNQQEKIKKIPTKKAKEILYKKLKESKLQYKKLYDKIDKFMNNIMEVIKSGNITEARIKLNVKYKELQHEIQAIQLQLFDLIEKLENQIKTPSEFIEFKNECLNDFYVAESEVSEHLDRIYGRLDYYIKNPNLIP